MGKLGDWGKGERRESENFFVSYSYSLPDGRSGSGTVEIVTEHGREGAGTRCVRQIKRKWPTAAVIVRQIWQKGRSPGGIYLPKGFEWIDDEVEGRRKKPI